MVPARCAFFTPRRLVRRPVVTGSVGLKNVVRVNRNRHTRRAFIHGSAFIPRRAEFTFVSNSGTNPPCCRANARLTVIYDPQNPQHAVRRPFVGLSFAPLSRLPVRLPGAIPKPPAH